MNFDRLKYCMPADTPLADTRVDELVYNWNVRVLPCKISSAAAELMLPFASLTGKVGRTTLVLTMKFL